MQLSGLALFLLFMAGAVVSWAFGLYYMVRTLRGFRDDLGLLRYLPVALFRADLFTEEGNRSRVRLLRALALFFFFVGVPLAFGFATGNLAS